MSGGQPVVSRPPRRDNLKIYQIIFTRKLHGAVNVTMYQGMNDLGHKSALPLNRMGVFYSSNGPCFARFSCAVVQVVQLVQVVHGNYVATAQDHLY